MYQLQILRLLKFYRGGGGIIWEKEKVYRIDWIKDGQTTSDSKEYNDHLYTSFELIDGKIVPCDKAKYGLWGSLFYYIKENSIKKLEFSHYIKEIVENGHRQIMVFDVYTGKIIGEYR